MLARICTCLYLHGSNPGGNHSPKWHFIWTTLSAQETRIIDIWVVYSKFKSRFGRVSILNHIWVSVYSYIPYQSNPIRIVLFGFFSRQIGPSLRNWSHPHPTLSWPTSAAKPNARVMRRWPNWAMSLGRNPWNSGIQFMANDISYCVSIISIFWKIVDFWFLWCKCSIVEAQSKLVGLEGKTRTNMKICIGALSDRSVFGWSWWHITKKFSFLEVSNHKKAIPFFYPQKIQSPNDQSNRPPLHHWDEVQSWETLSYRTKPASFYSIW